MKEVVVVSGVRTAVGAFGGSLIDVIELVVVISPFSCNQDTK